MKIRQGINEKNYIYWRDDVFIKMGESGGIASIRASLVCHRQELEILKDRIIKLEKNNKK